MMGTPVHMIEGAGDLPRSMPDEAPQHRVKISRPFYLQATEVTQAQFLKIMGRNPSHHKKCDRCPVEHVSWNDAREFVRRLNAREMTDKYRLPTEAEWEYAYRATTTTDYYCGKFGQCLNGFEWCEPTAGEKTHPVGLKKPNPWGVFDLACNVPEWCSDWYAKDFYKKSPLTDPKGPASGRKKVARGGQFDTPWWCNTAAHRESCAPSDRTEGFGFRVVRQAP
jgi:formylglycine-generating enzyme required for sulfatase activity